MFQKGDMDLIDYFMKQSNKKTSLYLEKIQKEHISEKIRDALKFRLLCIEPYLSTWPQVKFYNKFFFGGGGYSLEL